MNLPLCTPRASRSPAQHPACTAAALRRVAARATGWAAVALVAGCSSLLPKPTPPPALYTLQAAAPAASAVSAPAAAAAGLAGATLLVLPPQPAAGYDSARIVYTRAPQRLEYFAHSEWVDTPARMLTPLMVAALAQPGRFGAVVQAPSGAAGTLRLETQLLHLHHDFSTRPSRVHLALRAQLLDSRTRAVLATRLFEHSAVSGSEDAAGGVAAAQRALQAVLGDLVPFCTEAAARVTPGGSRPP